MQLHYVLHLPSLTCSTQRAFSLLKGSGCRPAAGARGTGSRPAAGTLQPCPVLQSLKRWFVANPPVSLALPSARPPSLCSLLQKLNRWLVASRWAVSQGPVRLRLLSSDKPRGPHGGGDHLVGSAWVGAGVSVRHESRCKVRSDTPGQRAAPVVAQGGWWEPSGCSTSLSAAAPERGSFGEGEGAAARTWVGVLLARDTPSFRKTNFFHLASFPCDGSITRAGVSKLSA